jgi:ferric-dicitrate binding protein FerR (iron transport regulator)
MSDDRLAVLISEYLEGTLGEAERAELNELLVGDAGARARFAKAMRQETLMGDLLRDARPGSAPATRRRSARAWRRTESPRGVLPWVAAAAAGLLVTAALVLASRPPAPRPEPVVRKAEAPAVEDPRPPVPPPPARELPPPPAPAPRPERVETPVAPAVPAPEKPVPAPAPAPVPEPPAPVAPPTVTVLATLKAAEGEVVSVTARGRGPARAGDAIVGSQGIETADGRATVVYPDGTRLEISPATRIRAFTDQAGKGIELLQGALAAQVTKQPAGRPMVVTTPHGEARVLGTALRLVVDPGSTRLEVREGKVRLTRADGKSADVAAGTYAAAGPAIEPKVRALPANRPLDLDPSLIGHWKLDEGRGRTLVDSSFGANDGTVDGAGWAPGRLGAALRFDGVDDVGVVQGRFPFPKNALTVALWVRHESLPGKVQRYLVVRSDVDLAALRHDGADRARQFDFFIHAGGAYRHLRANDALVPNAWIHVAGTWDGQLQRAYVNGVEAARQETAGGLGSREGSEILIGVPREPMHGWMDDLRLYNRALTDKEIAELANLKR